MANLRLFDDGVLAARVYRAPLLVNGAVLLGELLDHLAADLGLATAHVLPLLELLRCLAAAAASSRHDRLVEERGELRRGTRARQVLGGGAWAVQVRRGRRRHCIPDLLQHVLHDCTAVGLLA